MVLSKYEALLKSYFLGNKDKAMLIIYRQLHSLPFQTLTYISQAPMPFSLRRGLANGRHKQKTGGQGEREASTFPLSALGSFSGGNWVSSVARLPTQHTHRGSTFCHVVLSVPFKLEVVAASCCGLSPNCLSSPL